MMHLSSIVNYPTLGLDSSEPLTLVKPESICIDLGDLLSVKTLKTCSSLSTNDSTSIKADEETAKSVLSGEIEFSQVNSDPLQQKVTLGDIISKRAYTKRSNKKATGNSEEGTTGRKRLAQLDGDAGDLIVKKEKLEIKTTSLLENQTAFPELVWKDGKVQVAASNSVETQKKQELEVVHYEKKKVTTSTSFKQMVHTEKWTEKETEKFYRALQLFGTDFSMIAKVFKSRNRNQIKNKFLREERIAPEKVDSMLNGAKSTNFQTLFSKFEKIKKTQKSVPIKSEEGKENENKNLLFPVQRSIATSDIKTEEIQICGRDRSSGSFHSTTSIDSTDRSIMEDLADILMPQKKLFGN